MTKTLTMTAPAQILDRTVKHSRIKFAFDPSEEQFLARSKNQGESITLTITPNPEHCPDMGPILMVAWVKKCIFEVENAMIQGDRLRDLEYLINDEKAIVMLQLGYSGDGDLLDGVESVRVGRQNQTGKDDSATEDTEDKPEAFAEDPPKGDDGEAVREPLSIKCKGMKQAWLKATITGQGDHWTYAYEIQMGNYHDKGGCIAGVCPSRMASLEMLKDELHSWFEQLHILGAADSKRATQARRDQMREQVNAELDKLIEAARSSAADCVGAT